MLSNYAAGQAHYWGKKKKKKKDGVYKKIDDECLIKLPFK